MAKKSNDTKDFLDVLEKFLGSKLKGMHTAYPAKLIKYDAVTQKATIQHSIKFKFKGKEASESYANIIDVPVHLPRGESYIDFAPIQEGDLGLAIVVERSLNEWSYGNGNPTYPNEERMFDLSDSCWIPGLYPFSRPWAGSIPANAKGTQVKTGTKLYLGNDSGTELLDLFDQLLDQLGLEGALTGGAVYSAIKTELAKIKV